MSRTPTTPPTPRIPTPHTLWTSAAFWIWVAYALFVIQAIPHFFVGYWFNQSLGLRGLFWTNFSTQALIFVVVGTAVALAIWLPVLRYAGSEGLRDAAKHVAVWAGTFAGVSFARHYEQLLLALNGVPFGRADPVFGHDIGFYVYDLPLWELALEAVVWTAGLGLVAAGVARWDRSRRATEEVPGSTSTGVADGAGIFVTRVLGPVTTRVSVGFVALLGCALAARTYLSRYGLLLRDNSESGVRVGAEYVDVSGFVSRLDFISLSAVVEVGLTALVCVTLLRVLRWTAPARATSTRAASRVESSDVEPEATGAPIGHTLALPLRAAGTLLAVELVFFLALVLRDHVFVAPNEPLVQLEYIERHMAATLEGYRLDDVETLEWSLPDSALTPEQLLASETVRNAPLLSSWVSYLEEPPDVQHFERIETAESKMVYGPLLQIYQQQQKLRPYYRFLSIDGVRYTVEGEKRMYASAVRELPSLAFVGPQEWLRYWGSAALLFTHGMGLVMSPVNEVDETGNPRYVSKNVPPEVGHPELEHEPRIYFGEGLKDDYVLTGVRGLREFDYPTAQFREEFTYPADSPDGIAVNSLFRRIVFAMYTGDFTAFLFSRYIDYDRTRVHILRTPISRAASIAPFLFLDSNAYAFVAGGRTVWMVNALTTTDRYPYSFPEILGDKADERAVEEVSERLVNYAEDAVKITLDAYSGEIAFYKVADDPIVDSWERIYPDLFEPASAMPEPVRAQLTYPLQWFHLQFDDIYKRYHQRNVLEFYNAEDLWDDADETLGSMGRGLSSFGTTDQMTFSYEGYDALVDPVDFPSGVAAGEPGDLQYVRLMPFTPEGARNLRSVIVAFQDPRSYGRIVSLQIPQGSFVPGPEQVDAYIDNDRPVHQQVTMWIRHGSEVIRGSTLLLPVRGDILYIEPIWVNSIQNELPQLKLVATRYRGRISSGSSLEAAVSSRRVEPTQDPDR